MTPQASTPQAFGAGWVVPSLLLIAAAGLGFWGGLHVGIDIATPDPEPCITCAPTESLRPMPRPEDLFR